SQALQQINSHALFDEARIIASSDAGKCFCQQFMPEHITVNVSFELVGNRQEYEVGKAHAINGGDKGHRDTATKTCRVRQVFHHMNQPQHCAENTDGRCITASRLPYLGCQSLSGFIDTDFHIQDFAYTSRLDAIDDQTQTMCDEWILYILDHL